MFGTLEVGSLISPSPFSTVPDSKAVERSIHDTAALMIRMGGRSCIVANLTGLSDSEVRSIYQSVLGKSSPSGQQPTDINWFLKSPLRRVHASLLISLYALLEGLPTHTRLAEAYYAYARSTAGLVDRSRWVHDPAFRLSEKDYVIPFSRAYFLVSLYSDDVNDDGHRICELMNRRCKRCRSLFMSHVSETSCICPSCQ